MALNWCCMLQACTTCNDTQQGNKGGKRCMLLAGWSSAASVTSNSTVVGRCCHDDVFSPMQTA